MAEALDWELAGEPVRLLADRALYWPSRRRLLLADLHLGKADVFRASGVAVPRGGTAHDLSRLAALVDATGAHSAWILGDVLHGRADQAHWRAAWEAFRDARPALGVVALAGNHDRALRDAGLGIDVVGTALRDGPFLLAHVPMQDADAHVVCGHLHPVLKLPGQSRTPAFWLRDGCTVLPAFSVFTGGVAVALAPGESAVACNGEHVLRISAPKSVR